MFSWTTPEDGPMADLVGGEDKWRCWSEVLKPFFWRFRGRQKQEGVLWQKRGVAGDRFSNGGYLGN